VRSNDLVDAADERQPPQKGRSPADDDPQLAARQGLAGNRSQREAEGNARW